MRREPLWAPSPARAAATAMHAFRAAASERAGRALAGTAELHRWSVERPADFWTLAWERCGIVGERGARALEDAPGTLRRARWFPDARLSFAENLLAGPADEEALVAYREGREGAPPARLTRGELRAEVARWRAALERADVGPGTTVGAWVGNGVEAVAALLATSELGALWASCGSDFGPEAVLDRLAPLAPRVLLAVDGYRYRGKAHDSRPALAAVAEGLPSLERIAVAPWLGGGGALPARAAWLADFLPATAPERPFTRRAFEHPLYALFSSGTTGKPKCMLHGAGNVLLQHAKEHRLHCDVRAGDRVLYHTTCGWMMWNWVVSALAARATVVLYDGDPLHPVDRLFALAAEERLTFLGSSARSFDAMRRAAAVSPRALPALRTVASTGSALTPETHAWLQRALGDVHVASISGGTDIVSCFALGDPTAPVYAGELQTPGLGMDVDVLDPDGKPLRGAPGELVCRPPFPSMPLAFHDDLDDARYRRAYFERFPGVWRHGDWAEWSAHGGLVIHGRSDATLNANGVRIGTAELYRELERFPEVVEACAVEHHRGDDEGIALLLRLAPGGATASAELFARIRAALRANRSPRHVPRWIAAVDDLPRTKSGKLSELSVRDVLSGRVPENRLALANPECLDALARLELD